MTSHCKDSLPKALTFSKPITDGLELDSGKEEEWTRGMKLNSAQIEKLVNNVIALWKQNGLVEFKADEQKVYARARELIQQDYNREMDLEREVNAMLDKLEQSNPGEFQRFKMFPMLKQKLAKEKGIVL